MSDARRRMLTLLSLLQGGRTWSGPELATRLEVSVRTLRRDVDELRALGYPVVTRPGPGGYYRLTAGTSMPPLLLTDDEAVAVTVGLRMAAPALAGTGRAGTAGGAAALALHKLEQVLPRPLRRQVTAVGAATETGASSATAVDPSLLGLLAAAAQRHELVSFRYRAGRSPQPRLVEPYRQVFTRDRWYLLAWDRDPADWRTFRLDRVRAAELTGSSFVPRPLPAESATAYLDAELRAARHHVVLTLRAPLEDVAGRLRHREGELVRVDADSCRFETWVDSYEWLAAVVLALGVEFSVDGPDGLRDFCRTLRDRLARAVG